ncbi:MAG: EAL domain-containing protein [Lactobacillaceae bacterium]
MNKIERLLEDILQTTSGIYSINIDPQQLYYEETFVLFEHSQKFNKRLKIELTEHLPYQRKGDYTIPFPLDRIVKLHEWGYEIVLDDFLSGINGIDKLISLSPLISRVKISKLVFKEKVSDSCFCSFLFEIAHLIQEVNPKSSLVIEAEESKEMIRNDKKIFRCLVLSNLLF